MRNSERPAGRRDKTFTLEEAFRVAAFHIFWEKTFRRERDHLVRFAKALAYSAMPIPPDRLPLMRQLVGGRTGEDEPRSQAPAREVAPWFPEGLFDLMESGNPGGGGRDGH